MARYILIDNCSGYIWGDSADLDGKIFNGTPLEFAAALCHSVDPSAAATTTYEDTSRYALASNEAGFHVYRADINGSEAIPVVQDGQDKEMIAAVERDCSYVTTIRCGDTEG
jgi:hypothetical protein